MIRIVSALSKLTVASLAALALAAGVGAGEPAPVTAPRPRVRLLASEPGGAVTWVAANLQAARRATVATRLAASVRAVHVEEGQEVAPGQLLVSLADSDVRGQLAGAEAAFAAASAHERRIRALVAERAATPSELEGATAQRAQAEAAVSAVRANLQYTELRAPIAGTVQARRVDPGDFVGPGQPLVVLEGSALELAASLSDDESRGLAVGQRLAFRAGAVEGTAEITALTRGGDPLSHRRSLRARLLGGGGALRGGAFARLAVPGAGLDAGLWLPRSALVERGDLTGVFVAAAGRAELRWVSIGERVGDRTSVRAGLSRGERVIEDPGALRDGQEIEVLP